MMRFFVVLFLVLGLTQSAGAQEFKIAAVVNDDVISRLDVEERMRFVIATTGLSDTPETKKRLLPQIVRSLIDEALQMQAARQSNIKVSTEEVDGAIADIEKQRDKPAGSLVSYLKLQGVNPDTFRAQVKSQIAWNKLIGRRVGGLVAVSSEEIQREIEQEKHSSSNREQALISGFVLPVDKPENEEKTKQLAEKLEKEIEAGASFDAVAAQLTSVRGMLKDSWVDLAALDPAIAKAIREQAGPGMLPPIRTAIGYHILRLSEKRQAENLEDAEMNFKIIKLSLGMTAKEKEVYVLMDIAKQVAKNPGRCKEKGVAGINSFEGLNIDVDYLRTPLSKLSPDIIPLVKDLQLEQVSEPFATPTGLNIMMLCEKVKIETGAPDKDKVREELLRQKIDLEAMRYLRDLRRDAFVEVRIR